jgi:hypothetical protein
LKEITMIDNTPDLGAEYGTEADTPTPGPDSEETVESAETAAAETTAAPATSGSA